MALLSSSGLTDVPSTANVTGPSDYSKPFVNDVLGKGQALLNAPMPQYQGQLTAGTSDIQNQAWKGLSNLTLPSTMTTAGQNLLDVGQKAQGVSYTPAGSDFTAQYAQQYMNPYLQASLNPQLEEARRQALITQQGNAAKATSQGAFGGSRQALMDTETQRALGTNLANITGQGYNAAYDKAMAQFNADQARKIQEAQYGSDLGLKGLTAATSANQAAGNIGAQQAQYGLQNLQALATAGNTQQAQEQAALNAQYNQYLDQRNYPSTMLKNQADLIKSIGGSQIATYGAKPSFLQSAVGTTAGVADLIKNLTASGKSVPAINSILKSMGINPSTLAPSTAATYNNTVDANGNPVNPSGGDTVVNDPLGGDYSSVYPDATQEEQQSWNDWQNYYASQNDTNDAYYSDTPVEP